MIDFQNLNHAYYSDNEIKLYCGDTLQVLKTFPDEFVDCVITSPPYWALRDYGTATWEGGDPNCNHRIDRFGNRKVTDKTNIDQSKQGSVSGEYVPDGQACPKCGAIRKDKQLGLEPTFQEYITKLCDIFDEVKRVLKKTGTCWVNLGDTYAGSGCGTNDYCTPASKSIQGHRFDYTFQGKQPKIDLTAKSLCLIPFRFALEMQSRGWILRNVIIWHKPNCMPSSVKDRFTVDFEYVFFFVKNKKYWFEPQYEPWGKDEREAGITRAKKYGYYGKGTYQDWYNNRRKKNRLGSRK